MLLERARSGDKRSIARILSVVENDEPGVAEILRATYPAGGRARVVGVTGPPGGGKSTLVSLLIAAYRERGDRVAVVAVDPSSPFSGGAILGDRIRMRERFLDEGVYIRSMASRGHAGGLARPTARVVGVLDALGMGTVIVETVGVGQEEVDVMQVAGTVCLVTVPGLGDDIQAIKAGVLEIADVLVVNKADRPGADETVRDLAMMLSVGRAAAGAPRGRERRPPLSDARGSRSSDRSVAESGGRIARGKRDEWDPPILRTSAAKGEGVAELVSAIDSHREWAERSGELARRRQAAARAEVVALLRETLLRRLEERIGHEQVEAAVARVAERTVDPYSAVAELLREPD